MVFRSHINSPMVKSTLANFMAELGGGYILPISISIERESLACMVDMTVKELLCWDFTLPRDSTMDLTEHVLETLLMSLPVMFEEYMDFLAPSLMALVSTAQIYSNTQTMDWW